MAFDNLFVMKLHEKNGLLEGQACVKCWGPMGPILDVLSYSCVVLTPGRAHSAPRLSPAPSPPPTLPPLLKDPHTGGKPLPPSKTRDYTYNITIRAGPAGRMAPPGCDNTSKKTPE